MTFTFKAYDASGCPELLVIIVIVVVIGGVCHATLRQVLLAPRPFKRRPPARINYKLNPSSVHSFNPERDFGMKQKLNVHLLLWYKTKAWSTVQCKQETLENIEHYHQQDNDDNKAHNVTNKETLLSRSKRFISFPLGSSFSTSICMTTGVIGNPNQSYLSMGLNWGIAYDLPNITWVLAHAHGFKAATRQQDKDMIDAQIKRRHRRALYNKLEIAISSNLKIPYIRFVILQTHIYQRYTIAPSPTIMVEKPIKFLVYYYLVKYYILSVIVCETCLNSANGSANCSNDAKEVTMNSKSNHRKHFARSDELKLNSFDEIINKNLQIELRANNGFLLNSTQSRTMKDYVVESSPLDPSLKNTTLTGRTAPHSSSLSSSPSSPLFTSLTQRQQAQEHLLSRPKRYLSFPEGSSFSVCDMLLLRLIACVCMRKHVYVNKANCPFDYMSFGLNWGVAYDLPNTTWILNHLHGFGKHPAPLAALHRRYRRNLYKEIEIVMDNMGYNGHDCVLRALCESRQYFRQEKMSMIGEMLRTIFREVTILCLINWLFQHHANRPERTKRPCITHAKLSSTFLILATNLAFEINLPKQRLLTRELDEHSDIALYDHAYREAHSVTRCEEQYHQCGFSLLELAFGRYSKPPKGY
uniref:Uncharacterized protein n=1 Tax=Glossina pallidipes TaxID=7398 RepID=A0A1A9ZCJ1_GLOPL